MFALEREQICRLLYGDTPPAQPFVKTEFITGDILKKIMPNMPVRRADELAIAINQTAPLYELNRPGVFHEFIAQCAEESGEFTRFEENVNYSAQGLANTWPNRYAIDPKAQVKVPNPLALKLNRNPQAIANNCYANRMGNGNEASGDGWKYRGGGPIQITGRDMWAAYAKYKGMTLETALQLVKNDLTIGVDSAMWVFVVQKKLLDEAEKDEFLAITKAINGGTNGLEKRQRFYERAKMFLPE